MTATPATIAIALLLGGVAVAQTATDPTPATAPATAESAASPATTQAAADVDPQVEAWLAQLGDDDLAARDDAQRKLLDVADDQTPAIRAARAASRDPDVRMRLDTLLAERGERSLIGASRVTLRFADAPLADVLAAFSKATGAQLDDNVSRDGQPAVRLSVDVRDASYWQALTAIAGAGKVAFQPQGDRMLHVYRANQVGGGATFRGTESGPFLFQAMSATYSRSQSYLQNNGGNVGEPQFTFQMQVLTEPKLRLADGATRVDVRRAVDSAGNDLLAANRNLNSNVYGMGNDAININLSLGYPKQPGDRIGEISGTIHVPVATRSASIDVADLLGQPLIERDLAGVRVEIRPVIEPKAAAGNNNNNNNNFVSSHCEFVVTIGRDAADPQAADRVPRAFQRARVTDGAGRPMQMTSFSSEGNGQRTECRVGFTAQNVRPGQPGGGPYALHVDVPTAYRDLDVPFTFKDLKMP